MREKYDKKFEIEIELCEQVLEDVRKNYPNLEKYAIGRLQRGTMRIANRYYKSTNEVKGAQHLFDIIDSYPNCLDLKARLKLFALRRMTFLMRFLYKITGKV